MFGLFGIFGRAAELERLDLSLRAAGLHPRAVPEAVKLTTVKLLKQARGGSAPDQESCAAAAALLGYCILGSQDFGAHNGAAQTEAADMRLAAACETGQGLDARLVLLTMQAGLIHPTVVERYQLTME
ncbi:MAG TPA: hypothetical protein VK479_05670 [Micropepsaceae bacterium]|nr:hypothetical protein [Micropepsaceae bacterium]